MADKEKEKAKVDLGLLEEDDEFEEFPAEGKIKTQNRKSPTMTNRNFYNKISLYVFQKLKAMLATRES